MLRGQRSPCSRSADHQPGRTLRTFRTLRLPILIRDNEGESISLFQPFILSHSLTSPFEGRFPLELRT
jgi:hypothetical protein